MLIILGFGNVLDLALQLGVPIFVATRAELSWSAICRYPVIRWTESPGDKRKWRSNLPCLS